ncbi:DUF4177 domain-containing protein, partial [[Ruminococcus] gnavus]
LLFVTENRKSLCHSLGRPSRSDFVQFQFESVNNYEFPKGERAMYQYEYETVSCNLEGWGFGSGYIYSIEDYRSIISERAKDGWRYVGCIPTKQRGTGHIQEMDLIFEKEL